MGMFGWIYTEYWWWRMVVLHAWISILLVIDDFPVFRCPEKRLGSNVPSSSHYNRPSRFFLDMQYDQDGNPCASFAWCSWSIFRGIIIFPVGLTDNMLTCIIYPSNEGCNFFFQIRSWPKRRDTLASTEHVISSLRSLHFCSLVHD